MKKIILLLIVGTMSLLGWAQKSIKTLDYIFLNDGNTIETRIIRVNNNTLYYTDPKTFQIVEISLDKVRDYEFNDGFFETDQTGEMKHAEVVILDGYTKDEIYRAIKDWFFLNSRKRFDGIIMEDSEYSIILGTISTPNYLKLDFVTVMSFLADDVEIISYFLNYDVHIRVKENRFKIEIENFTIQSDTYTCNKLLPKIYEKRRTKEGIATIHLDEIMTIKKMISDQILSISDHCKLVRLNDTFHNQIVKESLSDDLW